MIAQLPLALRWPRRQRFEHFHPGANAVALAAVSMLAEHAQAPWVYLNGPDGAGKSHLLIAACQGALNVGRTVQYLPLASLADRAQAIRGVVGSELLALDDLGAIAGDDAAEHALFDAYNQARADGASLLFAAQAPPQSLGLQLPDLRSRLGACTQFLIKPLDEAERRQVLRVEAELRGIQLEANVLDWLFIHHVRDLETLLDLLEKLDRASLAARRKVTVAFLRNLLRESDEDAAAQGE